MPYWFWILIILFLGIPAIYEMIASDNVKRKAQNYEKRSKYLALYRQGKHLIETIPSSSTEREKLRIFFTVELKEMEVSKSAFASIYGYRTDANGDQHSPPPNYAQILAEFDDAINYLGYKIAAIQQANSNASNTGNAIPYEQNQDNVRRSQPQQQPNWKTTANETNLNADFVEQGLIFCGYSSQEAKDISINRKDSMIILKDAILGKLQRKGMTLDQAERTLRLKGFAGILGEKNSDSTRLLNS